jgi:hypothetical protein
MAKDPCDNRKPSKGTTYVKPTQDYYVFEDSNGKLYVLNERNANAALTAVYGDNYGRQIAGFATTEALNFGISAIKGRAGAGTGEVIGTIVGKIVLKGGSKTIGDAIAGEEVSLGTLGYNVSKELTKPSNFAPGAKFEAPNGKVQEGLNALYAYKYKVNAANPSFAKQKISLGSTKYGDIKLQGEIGALSPGKHVEKYAVGKVKQLFAKPCPDKEEKHERKQYEGFGEVDYQNLDRLMASGLSESAALAEITKSKTSKESIGLSNIAFKAKESAKELASDVENNMTGFTYLKHKYDWREDDEEYRQEMIAFAEDRIKAKYGGKMTPEGKVELDKIIKEYWKAPMKRYIGGAAIDPIDITLTLLAGAEKTVSDAYTAITNLTGVVSDVVGALLTQEADTPSTTVTSKKYNKSRNPTNIYGTTYTGHLYDPGGFYADRSHLGPVGSTYRGTTKQIVKEKKIDKKTTSSNATVKGAAGAAVMKKSSQSASTTQTLTNTSKAAGGFIQTFVKVGFSKWGL